ncbi:MAG: hypothetical protein NTZ44_00275 [Candidatus Nomurabacteria bacterium]|nr:hypothetical protein [Candidatus Nomurabacteria bacterium]
METYKQSKENEPKMSGFSLDLSKISTRVMQELAKQITNIPIKSVQEIIKDSTMEIERLESVGNPKYALEKLTPEIAKNTVALWVFSGPDDNNDKDRYKHIKWAHGMDQARLNYAALLERKMSELCEPETSIGKGPMNMSEKIQKTKELIERSGPTIIYNGSDPLNTNVENSLKQERMIIPEKKVFIDGKGIVNTVDQIKDFSLPEELHQKNKEIGIISHAPHLLRIMHMLNKYQTLPKDMTIRLYPISSPIGGNQEYAELETMGLLYYIANKNATKESYPYIIHGEIKK